MTPGDRSVAVAGTLDMTVQATPQRWINQVVGLDAFDRVLEALQLGRWGTPKNLAAVPYMTGRS